MKKPKSHYFRGLKYRIHWRVPKSKGAGGTCDPPKARNPAIEFHPDLKGLNKLRVMIHEALHAEYWDLDEVAVDQGSCDIALLLWEAGARFIEDDK